MKKSICYLVLFCMREFAIGQVIPLNENDPPESVPSGIYHQVCPASCVEGWKYGYGVKLSVFENNHRNFEIMNTHKDHTSTLAFRTYDGVTSEWTEWKEFLHSGFNTDFELHYDRYLSSSRNNGDGVVNLIGFDNANVFHIGQETNWIDLIEIHNPVQINDVLDIKSEGDGVSVLKLSTERPWRFVQTGSADLAMLSLQSSVDDKDFFIRSQNGTVTTQFRASNTPSKNRIHLAPEGGRVIIGEDGMDLNWGDKYQLIVDGKVISEEIDIVPEVNSVPDYVFEDSYELRDLENVKEFIKKNKHLPDVPSATEIKANGKISLGEWNMLLLKKIEELTLYVIDLKEENDMIKKKLETMKHDE